MVNVAARRCHHLKSETGTGTVMLEKLGS
jgi:hypothetical protein